MTQTKKIPQRKCVGCQEMKDKSMLIRVIRTPEGEIQTDETGRKNGRGAYLCRQTACLERARKAHSLERSLKSAVSAEMYEALKEEIEKSEDK